jgi:cell division protein FtsB
MLEFRQKRKIRHIIYSPIALIVLFVIVIILAKATWNMYTKEAESRTYRNEAQAQLDTVSASQSALSAQVAELETPEGVETAIRSQFLVAKPGEQVAVIVDGGSGNGNGVTDSGSSSSDSDGGVLVSTSSAVSTSTGFWGSIIDFFKF